MSHQVSTVRSSDKKSVKPNAPASSTQECDGGRTAGEELHIDRGIQFQTAQAPYGGNRAPGERGEILKGERDDVGLGNYGENIGGETVVIQGGEKGVITSVEAGRALGG